MSSLNVCFYFHDEEEKKLFDFIQENIKSTGVSDDVQVTTLIEDIDKLSDGTGKKDCIVVPFCTKNFDSFIGLKKAREYRGETGDYKTPFLFLIYTCLALPDFLKPQNIKAPSIKKLIGNPQFGEVEKAILMAEAFFDVKDNELKNFVIFSTEDNFFQDFLEKLKWIKTYDEDGNDKIRKSFYDTFINYYRYIVDGINGKEVNELTIDDLLNLTGFGDKKDDDKKNDIEKFKSELEKIKIYNQILKETDLKLNDIFELAQYIHCFLNGLQIPQKEGTHNIPLELFCAPVPFPLQGLFDAKREIYKKLEEGDTKNKIKLLLIDNKLDKVVEVENNAKSYCEGGLVKVLTDRKYRSVFELRMRGEVVASVEQQMEMPQNKEEYNQFEENLCFNFKDFKDSLDEFRSVQGDVSEKDKSKYYAWRVYKEINSSNFILLDFFLNEFNTYLAFDFIRDIAEIKKNEGDYSTTWYFITSAVYDSVVKYSQSGLLAEYYESAVVNAGDDPTNEKRQIIFVYKLLTFVNARLKNFQNYKKVILESKLFECEVKKGKDECKICLENIQTLSRKYVAEFGEIKSLVAETEEEKKFKENVELIDSIITNFFWLPEADWPMIQMQIELLKHKKLELECKYIKDEMKTRADSF